MTLTLPASQTVPTQPDYLSFTLPDELVAPYAETPVRWGFDVGGGNSLGEIVFYRSYSRTKDDGSKERWHEACQRVIEGMYSLQLDHVKERRMSWSAEQGLQSAREAYDRLFHMKWTPPGRGLFAMGSPLVNGLRNSAPLFNCATVDFVPDDAEKYIDAAAWLMEASALGIGVGFVAHPTSSLTIYEPIGTRLIGNAEIVEHSGDPDGIDSREGWCYSLKLLMRAFLLPNQPMPDFSEVYPLIRPRGAALKTFGGTASGPESLRKLHNRIAALLTDAIGTSVDSRITTDIANMIGKCIVAGAKRRSAELAAGWPHDEVFLDLKNIEVNPQRLLGEDSWGWMSNNSIISQPGMDYGRHVERTVMYGEPGYLFLDLARDYGRMVDGWRGDDHDVVGTNPCAEIFLADRELCCLSTIHLNRAESKEDFLRTIKFAYLYAKTVLLLPTMWPETNTVMLRNQRIGVSLTGVANFVDQHGWHTLRQWMDEGYREVARWDKIYSDWLCVRPSIRMTTIKPEGSTSILSGASPGDHWSVARAHTRRIEMTNTDPLVEACRAAGYHVEPKVGQPDTTVVIEFPIIDEVARTEDEVSIYEKVALAVETQRWWADNSVSVTVTFDPATESDDVERVLHMHEGQLKSISFMPRQSEVDEASGRKYPQLPFETMPDFVIRQRQLEKRPMNWDALYAGQDIEVLDGIDSKYCTTDACTL